MSEHSRSISAAKNLELSDFSCRFIILQSQEADLIGTVEAAMTRKYNPLWNLMLMVLEIMTQAKEDMNKLNLNVGCAAPRKALG
ncbi:MAG: Eco29kI family restriction endonuclease [Thiolinea sp.]